MVPTTRSQSRKAASPTSIHKPSTTLRPSGICKAPTIKKRPLKTHPKVLGPLGSSSRSQTCSLLNLPPEIRTKIWSYVLASPSGFLHYSSQHQRYRTSESSQYRHNTKIHYNLGLLRTCHQIALETLHLPLKVNTIITPDIRSFLEFKRKIEQKEAAQGWQLIVPKLLIGSYTRYIRK